MPNLSPIPSRIRGRDSRPRGKDSLIRHELPRKTSLGRHERGIERTWRLRQLGEPSDMGGVWMNTF